MKNYVIIAKMMIIFIAVLIIALCGLYRYEIRPMTKESKEYTFNVVSGDTWYSIGSKLFEKKLIRSEKFYKIYIKIFTPGNLEVGEYKLNSSMSLPELVETLETNATNPNIVNVTFKEGKNIRNIAKVISEYTSNTEEDFFNALADNEYIDSLIKEYWFLTDDIKNADIYYPLEGYLFPSTYSIDKTSDVKTIINTMLKQMDIVLLKHKNEIKESNYSIHELLTLASIVELEAGNSNDRASVAGVFYNRLKDHWTLGSDVTTYYALKIDDFSYSLSYAELATCNKYNTRSTCFSGLPVGPITNPGLESIEAVISPKKNDMYYFVADCSGKTYLSKNGAEHEAVINKLKGENNWCQ